MKRVVVASATAIVLTLVALTVTIAVQGRDDPGAGPRGNGYGGMYSMMRGDSGDWSNGFSTGQMGMWMQQSRVSSEEDFLTQMVAHHEEAITAAQQLTRSDRAEMRALGESIVESQSAQVEDMNAWLVQWYPDGPQTTYQPMMGDLGNLSGDRLDEAFLHDMIGHHMMAVMMSQQFLMGRLAEHPQVATLAQTIRDEQHAEIAQMMRWSREWFGTGWPHGYDPEDGSGMGMMR